MEFMQESFFKATDLCARDQEFALCSFSINLDANFDGAAFFKLVMDPYEVKLQAQIISVRKRIESLRVSESDVTLTEQNNTASSSSSMLEKKSPPCLLPRKGAQAA